jgi:four helix bundle protein
MENSKFIKLNDLRIYQLSRELSSRAWTVYSRLDWTIKKTMGDQFIDSIDSVGANIAEGYFRFHYLDKIKFYYNARGSHAEAILHWLSLLRERNLVNENDYNDMVKISQELAPKLNNYIGSIYRAKKDGK